MVVDPGALFAEVDELARHGIDVGDRLVVSDKAHLILPYHRDLDLLAEARRGERKIGTTSRGIGPAYEDKIARRGIRVGDLADPEALEQNVRDNVLARNRLVHDSTMDWKPVFDQLLVHAARLRPWVRDVSLMLNDAISDGQSILFEGAQGTLLDIDHGTYPYVTSSNASIGGVCTGLGIGPRAIGGVLGVAKAYTTRVGEGPLPTELLGEMGNRLRDSGNEYGAVTGRPRRCGWYDAVAVRYGVRINGLDALALTKLDVLDGLDRIDVCTSYRCGSRTLTEFPSDVAQLSSCEPIYESLPGWSTPTRGSPALCRAAGECAPVHRPAGGNLRGARGHRLDRIGARAHDRERRSEVPDSGRSRPGLSAGPSLRPTRSVRGGRLAPPQVGRDPRPVMRIAGVRTLGAESRRRQPPRRWRRGTRSRLDSVDRPWAGFRMRPRRRQR